MSALVGFALGVWVASFVARPRRPRGMDDAPWLVYSRLLGGVERIRLAGFVLLLICLFAAVLAVASGADRDLARLRDRCYDQGNREVCYQLNDRGEWVREEVVSDVRR